jgi:hypothetical protein
MKKWGVNDVPQFKAMFIVSLIMFLNIITVGLLLQKLWGIPFLKQPKEVTAFFLIGTGLFSYFAFVHNNKYESIKREFMNESPKQATIHNVVMAIFIMLAFGVNVWLAILLQ